MAICLLAFSMLFIITVRLVAMCMSFCCISSSSSQTDRRTKPVTSVNGYSTVDFEMTVVQIQGDSDDDSD